MTPACKKSERYSKDNYRSITIRQNLSKVFEKSMFCQISNYRDNFLPKDKSGFRKGYNVEYCFLKMLRYENQLLIKEDFWMCFWQTYLRLSFAFSGIFCLQECMLMGLVFPHQK